MCNIKKKFKKFRHIKYSGYFCNVSNSFKYLYYRFKSYELRTRLLNI